MPPKPAKGGKAASKKAKKAPKKKGAGGGDRRPDPTMKVGTKGANKTYTKQQFNDFYGAKLGASMWKRGGTLLSKKAGGGKGGGDEEKRRDPTMKPGQKGANKLYTRKQFTDFYGPQAKKMWTKAAKPSAKPQASSVSKRPDPTMKKGQKGAGKLYTKPQFTQFYGGALANKMWVNAGKLLAKQGAAGKGKKAAAPSATKRPDPTMKKGQKGAGKLYTRKQFTDFYGPALSKSMWVKAGKLLAKKAAPAPRTRGPATRSRGPQKKKAPPAPTSAKRPDPTMKKGQKGAGKLYTKAQYTQFYGPVVANKMWLKAGKLLAKTAPPPRTRGPRSRAPAAPPRTRGPRTRGPQSRGPRPAASRGPAQRRDPTMKKGQKGANKLYSKQQFVAFYGQSADKMWKKAASLK